MILVLHVSVLYLLSIIHICFLEVVSLVAKILPLVALFQVVDSLSACTAGILRAMGKQV